MLRATPFSPDRKYGIDSCSKQHSYMKMYAQQYKSNANNKRF